MDSWEDSPHRRRGGPRGGQMRQRGPGMSKLMLGSVRVVRSSPSIALRGAFDSQQRLGDAARDMASDHPGTITGALG